MAHTCLIENFERLKAQELKIATEEDEIEAATEAPAERTVEATVVAFVDTVLRHRETILNEFGNKPLFFPFPVFMMINPSF